MIVTFYSFKGGTGRTMALANIALLLARSGKRVLAVDFDLEAPGLWRFFDDFVPNLANQAGLLDMFGAFSSQNGDVDWHSYVTKLDFEEGSLSLITSGKSDEDYPARVLAFRWQQFFSQRDGGSFIEKLRMDWNKEYDFVLIDSRTGITDTGGVCTIALPDLIVPICVANHQNVDGTIEVLRRAQVARQNFGYDRPPALVLPVLSRFDNRTEYGSANEWLDLLAAKLSHFYADWLPKEIEPRRIIERTKLPYIPYFSFGERLAVRDGTSDPDSLGYALNTVSLLIENHLSNAQEITDDASLLMPGRNVTGFWPILEGKLQESSYLWHYGIHSYIANENLIFVLVGFDPVYRRQRAVEETKRVLANLNISSYSLWELVGEYDLMIQAWLPRNVRMREFISTLGDTMSVEIETLTMTVESFTSHWMWKDDYLDYLEDHLETSDYNDLNEGRVPAPRILQYLQAGLIYPIRKSDAPEIFIRLTSPRRGTNRTIDAQIQEVAGNLISRGIITHGVIMKVSGAAAYLITGRLPSRDLAAVADALQGSFAQSGILETLRCRTIINIAAQSGPLDIVEQLEPIATGNSGRPNALAVKRWLWEPESDTLEFKSHAYTGLDQQLGGVKPTAGYQQVHEIAKTVVGMLNAAGGTVIIGVAELDRYSIEDLRRVYPNGIAEGHRRFVIGIDSELPPGGWDAYQRDLARRLRQIIEGDVDQWLRYYAVEIESRALCIIRVERPSGWFYLKSTNKDGTTFLNFYGRFGGATHALQGRQMDEFKETNPRTIVARRRHLEEAE